MDKATTKRLKILHFNDVYDLEEKQSEPIGGAARFITACEKYKDQNPLILFSGDIFSPSQLSPIKKGKHMLPFLEHAKVDVCCVGNHDLDFGKTVFEKLAEATKIPWLLTNVYEPDGKTNLCHSLDHLILEHEGLKIGIVGLAEEDWLDTIVHLEEDDYVYEDFVKSARKWVNYFEEQKWDLKIALTHMRMPNDERLADKVPELDMILGGHDHSTACLNINDTIICKSGSDFRELSNIDIILTQDPDILEQHSDAIVNWHAKGLIIVHERIWVTKDFEPHPEMKEIVTELYSGLKQKLKRSCGFLGTDLDCRFAILRKEETNAGNFAADVIRFLFKTDISLINAGTLRTDDIIKEGVLKYRDIENMLPMIEPFTVVRITGEQVKAALENGVAGLPKCEGKFPCVSGVKFEFDSTKEPYSRITKIEIGGEPFMEHKYYTLATKVFLVKGKDGYNVLKGSEQLREAENSLDLKTAIIDFLQDLVIRDEAKESEELFPIDEALKLVNNNKYEWTSEGADGEVLRHK